MALYKDLIDIDIDTDLPRCRLVLKSSASRRRCRKESFSSSVADEWNSLPESVETASSTCSRGTDLPRGRLLGLDVRERVGHHGDEKTQQDDGRDGDVEDVDPLDERRVAAVRLVRGAEPVLALAASRRSVPDTTSRSVRLVRGAEPVLVLAASRRSVPDTTTSRSVRLVRGVEVAVDRRVAHAEHYVEGDEERVERRAERSGDRRAELEERVESEAEAEQDEDVHDEYKDVHTLSHCTLYSEYKDVHDEEAGDVTQHDVLQHDRERMHRLETFSIIIIIIIINYYQSSSINSPKLARITSQFIAVAAIGLMPPEQNITRH